MLRAAGDCAPYAGPGLEKNASVFMADEAVQVFALKDGIVVPRALMVQVSRMLTCADMCRRVLIYAVQVFALKKTAARACGAGPQCSSLLTYADVC
jgi:hypothetical protein